MKKSLSTYSQFWGLAWNGAVTIFACIIVSLIIVGATLVIGAKVKEKMG